MKAILSTKVGGPETLSVGALPEPRLGATEVLVSVRACGINYPDVLLLEDKYQFKPLRPFAPGGEIAGVVEAAGEAVTGLARGDRVAAVLGWGGLVERVAVAPERCMKLPDAMPFDEAAAFVMAYGTSYYALKDRGALAAGETLLVLGAAGGVGSAAVQIGKAMGARVVAAASSAEKVALARRLGADEGVVYAAEPEGREAQKALADQFKAACGPDGAHVIYDAVGGAYAEPALRAVGWGGRYLVVGFPAGIPSFPLNLTLLKSCQVVGVFWGAHTAREPALHARNMGELAALYAAGKVRPQVSRAYPFERAGEAIASLAGRRATGKVVVLGPEAAG